MLLFYTEDGENNFLKKVGVVSPQLRYLQHLVLSVYT
jgi:hypothetical protein